MVVSDMTIVSLKPSTITTNVTEDRDDNDAVLPVSHNYQLCDYDQLPDWLQDNDYLRSGHRPALKSVPVCLRSAFRLHSETGNIWTHALPALWFALMFAINGTTVHPNQQPVDNLLIGLYYTGAIVCLSLSAMFHTLCCHSRPVSKLCQKLDYMGISIQMLFSMIPALYYIFYGQPGAQLTYILAGICMCTVSTGLSVWDKFGEPDYRPFRTVVFMGYGLSNLIPIVHWLIQMDSRLLVSFLLVITQGSLYTLGSLIYVCRLPERYVRAGRCDYLGQSHQLFHLMIALALYVHLCGISSLVNIRLNSN
ncbi:adiponectin receptor protein-like [Oppia nitens]|uniref:adiponectin receptor protein-like n=1 Tax=Oppia nitens TaxID=1686743 RepID=UPI0023D98E19|nr:adiponectin receptor protein-like [Oppia nitens]